MKSRVPQHFVLLLIAVALVICSLTESRAEVASDNDTERPRYVPNEIIVKYNKKAADKLEAGLVAGKKAGQMRLSDSLDGLGRKYKAKKFKTVFPGFKKHRRRLEALTKKDKSQLSKKEKHILRRMTRAPKGAKVPDLDRIYKIELEPGQSVEEVVAAYNRDPDVEYAHVNHILSLYREPNDPLYPAEWAMLRIQAAEAWDIHTGSSDVVVAVIDTGADYLHGDLRNNMWVNEAERNGAVGVDDDGNDYVDDIYGYNFAYNSGDPMDDHYHGTFCAGIIGAEGNNGLDKAGVCWDVSIMALKAFDAEGDNTVADIVEAVYYAVTNAADITSNSYGDPYIPLIAEAFAYACSQGVISVASAGNDGTSSPHYPAALPGVIAVAATNFFGGFNSQVQLSQILFCYPVNFFRS